MKHISAALLSLAAIAVAGTALAQGLSIPGAPGPQNLPQKAPPVKKFNNVCYPPESPFYARITSDFVPFVAMIDCVKSGGKPAKR